MPTPNPVAFTLFNMEIRWYGILIAVAILLAALIMMKRAPRHGLTSDAVLDILIISIPRESSVHGYTMCCSTGITTAPICRRL